MPRINAGQKEEGWLENRIRECESQGRLHEAATLALKHGEIKRACDVYLANGHFFYAIDLAEKHGMKDLAEMHKEYERLEPQPRIMS